MKAFVPALALATAVAAEADPQTLLVNSSPLLKTIVPQQAVKLIKPVTYTTTTHVQTPVAHVASTPLVYNAPIIANQQVQYVKPAEVKYEEVKPVEAEKKVEVATYANTYVPTVQQPITYAAQPVVHQPITYAAQPSVAYQTPLIYAQAAANKVYHAKNGEVEHTVINKREAEAEPIDYVSYQTSPYSSVKYPTLQKTLSAYNKVPLVNQYVAPQVVANQYVAPQQYVAGTPVAYTNQYLPTTPYVANPSTYQYVF